MAYLEHDNEFGESFLSKLEIIEKNIIELYKTRDQYIDNCKNKPIRLHASTINSKSAFACLSAISKNQITMGKTVSNYENLFGKYLKKNYEILSCNSGSSANLLAISTLFQNGLLKKGDKIIVPALSWSTTVFPLVQYGLIPVFCDSNDHDFNISVKQIEELTEEHEIKGIMLIHTYGCPVDMDLLNQICKSKNLILIEDTCESMGAEWGGEKVGTFGLCSSFSTYYSHHICTLEGGFVCFQNKELSAIAESVRSHGWIRHLSKDKQIFKDYSNLDPGFLFAHIGYNLRLSEPQAAIGIEQLNLLDTFISKRTIVAKEYLKFFQNNEDLFSFQKPNVKAKSSWFGFPLILKGKLKNERKSLRTFLLNKRIETRPFLAGDFTLQPVVNQFDHIKSSELSISRKIAESGLAIPCHQSLNEENASFVIEALKEFISKI